MFQASGGGRWQRMEPVPQGETEGPCGRVRRFVRAGLSGKLALEEARRLAGPEARGLSEEESSRKRTWMCKGPGVRGQQTVLCVSK